jgi:hypothetical protein
VAGKCDWRERVHCKDADFEHLRPGADARAIDQPSAVGDPDDAVRGRFGDVVHAQQTGELNAGVDLLRAFADRGVGGMLVVVDKASRQAPQTITRLDGAAAEHDPALDLNHDRRHHFRVAPKNVAVNRADFEVATFDCLDGERRPAVDAEMH